MPDNPEMNQAVVDMLNTIKEVLPTSNEALTNLKASIQSYIENHQAMVDMVGRNFGEIPEIQSIVDGQRDGVAKFETMILEELDRQISFSSILKEFFGSFKVSL